jgi:hypothetical protein
VKAAAAVYTKSAAKANVALSAFVAAAGEWPSTETGPEAESSASNAINVLSSFVTTLTVTHWPLAASSAIRTLKRATSSLVVNLQSLGNITDNGGATLWLQQFTNDATTVTKDAVLVGHDLDLPANNGQ